MTAPEIPLLIQCIKCESHINLNAYPNHICFSTEPYRLSQISCYEQNEVIDSIMKAQTMRGKRLTLTEIISYRKNQFKSRQQLQSDVRGNSYLLQDFCSRCHHSKAALVIAEKNYHEHCLKCFYCDLALDIKNIRVFKGNIYCNEHYQLLCSQTITCGACQRPIEAFVKPVIALDQFFHPEHLRCFHCNKTVDPVATGLKQKDNRVYCEPDYKALFSTNCQACYRTVDKEAVISKDGKLKGVWHKNCFKCQTCQAPFLDNKFYVHNNVPYCRLDYHRITNSICHTCSIPIEGDCLETFNNWPFHPECFVCSVCKASIQNDYYVFDDKVYCGNHEPKGIIRIDNDKNKNKK